jgi:amino acid adenylation domain-containing protein
MRMLGKRLLEHYLSGLDSGTPDPLPAQLTYTAYAQWQKSFPIETVEDLVFEWKHQLKHVEPLELNTDRKRALIHIYEGKTMAMELPYFLGKRLQEFQVEYPYAPQILLLTAFNVLLHKYTGQTHITVGTLHDNRDIPDLQHTAGPVANLLPLCTPIAQHDHFLDCLQKTDDKYAHAVQHKDLPFDKLVSELELTKDMSRTALFDVLFYYEKSAADDLPAGKCIELNQGLGKYDLNLLLKEEADGLKCFMTYNGAYFNEGSIRRLMEHYLVLLGNLLDSPRQPIASISFISDQERARLSRLFDYTAADHDRDNTIISVFEKTATQFSDHIAISFREDRWTYLELNELANRFSRFLSGLYPITHDRLVAIRLERGEWQIIAMLAVLKAGGAYLPVDPDLPEERIAYLLSDSNSIACIDEDIVNAFLSTSDLYDSSNRDLIISPEQLAYCIYTSGSTGKPKAVLIGHRNVVRLFRTSGFPFRFSEKDVWSLFHSFSFDFSVWEIYGALLFGGRLVIVPKEVARDTWSFKQLIRQESITVLNQTPTAFYRLQEIVSDEDELYLRYVIFGGERLLPARLYKWKDMYPGTCLVNMYGITETTVHTTFKEIGEPEIAAGTSNIGQPLPTLSCFVLDHKGELLPEMIPGELYVGGAGVAIGYHNRPELNAEKFIPNPFGTGRLYRSGDKVRITDDGELEYLGRFDDQVKVRGFRIESGEVELALLSSDLVDDAVIVLKEDPIDGEKHMIAFVTAKEQLSLTPLRAHLKNILPEHMIPEAFVQIDSIPLNENGKADKRSLAARTVQALRPDNAYQPPSGELEEKLVHIWQESLSVDRIGVNDDFFALGGHSIKVMEVIMKIQQEYGIHLPIKSFFSNPTIADLAREINIIKWAQQDDAAYSGAEVETIIV